MRDRLNTKILYELAYYGIIKFMLFASIKHRHIWREKIYHVGKTPSVYKICRKGLWFEHKFILFWIRSILFKT